MALASHQQEAMRIPDPPSPWLPCPQAAYALGQRPVHSGFPDASALFSGFRMGISVSVAPSPTFHLHDVTSVVLRVTK